MGMLVGQPQAVGVRIVFDQSAGCEDQRATLNIVAAATCRFLLRRIGHKIALLVRLEPARTGLAARPMLRRWILSALVLLLASIRAEAGCVDPAMPAHATVSITRMFDQEERQTEPDLLGIRGTGWFLSPRSMVTVPQATPRR
jgi:hypothetical protein